MELKITITREHTKTFPQHSHKTAEIMHYIKGEGVLKTEVGDFPFKKGTVIVVPADIMHGSCGIDYFQNICLHYSFYFPDLETPVILQNCEEAGTLVDLIFQIDLAGREKNQLVIGHLLEALEKLVQPRFAKQDAFSAKAEKVNDCILQHFTDPEFDIASVIASFNYADDYFRYRFRKEYGITPYAYLVSCRIEYAANLLQAYGQKLSVSEIAKQSGFKDPQYFSRLFKKKKGVSPRYYIKQFGK